MRLNTAAERDAFRNVWVVAEVLSGRIQPVTYELVGAARALADSRGCEVWAVALGADLQRRGRVIREPFTTAPSDAFKRVVEFFHSSETAVNLGDAQFIIAGGRGLKGPAGFDLLRQLAERVGGAVGASRAAVDAGWISYAHQVGQTGQTVQSKVYLACGISGQIQHLVGMQSCDLIIAVDKSADTPLMQLADIAVVGDLFEIVPELIQQIPVT